MKIPPFSNGVFQLLSVFACGLTAVQANVVINEVHYEPVDAAEVSEFIELHNSGAESVDLAGWSFVRGIDFTFPPSAVIPADGYVLIAKNPDGFKETFGKTAMGPWAGQLSNNGEVIELEDAAGERVDRVDYKLGFPWPTLAAGRGGSIELIHGDLDNELGSSWRYSKAPNPLPELNLLPEGSASWRYRRGDTEASNPIDAWRAIDFVEDDTWQTGPSPIGFGDGDDATLIEGMQSSFSSLFFRHEFEIAKNEIPGKLQLRHYVDDGVVVWINGNEVFRLRMDPGEVTIDSLAPKSGAEIWDETTLESVAGLLVEGRNVISAQGFNKTVGGSDFSFDLQLTRPAAADPDPEATPGRRNSVFGETQPPNIRQVAHLPEQPKSGEPVTVSAKITDPDGVGTVTLHYQVVQPGEYIRLTDEAFETAWTDVPMTSVGDVFSAQIPADVQVHRRLIRYRITGADANGVSVRVPFQDDTQPNFACFVYDGVPSWNGSLRPGREDVLTYSSQALTGIQTYHLISRESDINSCHYTESENRARTYKYYGTVVVEGKVYDHIRYRIKGRASTRQTGKNKTKINFNLGHRFQAKDDYGQPYNVEWDKFALHTGTCPWFNGDQSTGGMILNEAAAFKFYDLIGTPSCNTHFFQLRIIDDAVEANSEDQYEGDFWGLYLAIEEPDGRFLQERGLPDGNMYKMNGSPTKTNQGPTHELKSSDVSAFTRALPRSQTVEWYRENVDLEEYYNYKIGTTLVNNTDLRAEWNTVYYLHPETNRWAMLPWDLDLTWESKLHWRQESVWENWQRMFRHDELEREFQNRAREVWDLLVQSGDGAKVFDELTAVLMRGGTEIDNSIQANQVVWDYHDRKRKKGIWYKNNPLIKSADRNWPTMLQYYKDFVTEFPDSDKRGYGAKELLNEKVNDTNEAIPDAPAITYVGVDGFPVDGLEFSSSAFASTDKPTEFAAMKWRLAEITDPASPNFDPGARWIYEINPVWESDRIAEFGEKMKVPSSAVRPGKIYRARVKHLGASGQWSHWSDPVEFTAAQPNIDSYLGKLLVTELMYKPADPTVGELEADPTLTAASFEYVEVMNVGPTGLDLGDIRFTKGIEFDFVNSALTTIAPGQRLLIVANQSAFGMRCPGVAENLIAGEYTKSLSNSGERLKLSFGAGLALVDFDFGDAGAWPDGADLGDRSLVLVRPESSPNSSDPVAWREGTVAGGSPGVSDAVAFSGDPAVDGDNDKLNAFAEYAFGTSDAVATSAASLIDASIDMVKDDADVQRPHLEVAFQWRAGADDAIYIIEISPDLGTWASAAAEMDFRRNNSNGDGTVELKFRTKKPIDGVGAVTPKYVRVRVSTAP